jgi:hypothetical protein
MVTKQNKNDLCTWMKWIWRPAEQWKGTYMYVYMYVYMSIYIYIYIYIYTHTHTHRHVYIHTYIHMHIYMYTYESHCHKEAVLYIYTYIYIYIYIHKHICIYIYIWIYLHWFAATRRQSFLSSGVRIDHRGENQGGNFAFILSRTATIRTGRRHCEFDRGRHVLLLTGDNIFIHPI